MNVKEVLHIVGSLLLGVAVAMVPATVLAVMEGSALPWFGAIGVTAALGGVLWFTTPRRVFINSREGIAIVGLGWLAVVLVGSLPLVFSGASTSVIAALFESTSGFTATGATVFADVEQLPNSVLLWRPMNPELRLSECQCLSANA